MKKHKMHVHLGGSARLRAEPSKEALMARVACLALLSVASAGALAPPAVSTGSRSPSCAALSRRAARASLASRAASSLEQSSSRAPPTGDSGATVWRWAVRLKKRGELEESLLRIEELKAAIAQREAGLATPAPRSSAALGARPEAAGGRV